MSSVVISPSGPVSAAPVSAAPVSAPLPPDARFTKRPAAETTPAQLERVEALRAKVWEYQDRCLQLTSLHDQTLEFARGHYGEGSEPFTKITEHLSYIFKDLGTAGGNVEIPMRIRKLLMPTPCIFTMFPGLGGHESLSQYDIVLVDRFSRVKTRHDVRLESQLATSQESIISSPVVVSNMRAAISEEMAEQMIDLGLMPVFHRFRRPLDATNVDSTSPTVQSQEAADQEKFDWLARFKDRAYFSCGNRPENIIFAKRLIEQGAAGICIDVALGNSEATVLTVLELKDYIQNGGYNTQIIAGNVDTAEGYFVLSLAGADCVKVGIGPGSACTTRVLTRAGAGQGSALMDIARAKFVMGATGAKFIADGGIEGSGDVLAALANQAAGVMVGKLAARCSDSGALKRTINGKPHAWYFGEASEWARRYEQGQVTPGMGVEGSAQWLPVTGTFRQMISNITGGLRNALPYYNAKTIAELQAKFSIPQQLCDLILGGTTGINKAAPGTAAESGTRLY